MQTGSRITDLEKVEFLPWDPSKQLKVYDANHVRFSLGFLRSDPSTWFKRLGQHWLTLFHAVGIEVRVKDVAVSLDFPDGLNRVTPFEIDGELCVIGLDSESQQAIVHGIAPGCEEIERDITIEYIERRLISTLNSTWAEINHPLNCFFSPTTNPAEVFGSVSVTIQVGEFPCVLWFGLGPKILERLDTMWRAKLIEKQSGEIDINGGLKNLSIQLAELAVPPAMLIDYMRTGAIIGLNIPVSSEVILKLNSQPWARGTLGQFKGNFAIEITSLQPPEFAHPEQTTAVEISIAELEVDDEAVIEYGQVGAILPTNTALTATSSMVINNEHVTSALVGQIDNQFALNVLPK
jgi:hypothetical protein